MVETRYDIRLYSIMVEESLNHLFLEEKGISAPYEGLEAERLFKTPFGKKLGFLKNNGLFTREEINILELFQHERNRAIHPNLNSDLLKSFLDEKEIMRLSEIGNKAFNAVEDARDRRMLYLCELGHALILEQYPESNLV